MKHLKHLSLALILTLFTATVNAQSLLLNKLVNSKSSPIVLTLHVFSDHPFSDSISMTNYVGISKTAPCSDLKMTDQSSTGVKINFSDLTMDLTSGDVLQYYGKDITCIKSDWVMDTSGHAYSTGNIQLSWDETTQLFTVTPDKVNIDVSKE